MPDALVHELEGTLLLRLIEEHPNDSSPSDRVLVVHHVLRNNLAHVKRELTQTSVEYECLPLSRRLMLLQECDEILAALFTSWGFLDHAPCAVFEDQRNSHHSYALLD